MAKKETKITVNLEYQNCFESTPVHIATLGKITTSQLQEIMRVLNNADTVSGVCVKNATLRYNGVSCFGWMGAIQKGTRVLFVQDFFYDSCFNNKICPQCEPEKKYRNEQAMLKTCARNMRAGKCVDKLMCSTFGAVLFPRHYGKEK